MEVASDLQENVHPILTPYKWRKANGTHVTFCSAVMCLLFLNWFGEPTKGIKKLPGVSWKSTNKTPMYSKIDFEERVSFFKSNLDE